MCKTDKQRSELFQGALHKREFKESSGKGSEDEKLWTYAFKGLQINKIHT